MHITVVAMEVLIKYSFFNSFHFSIEYQFIFQVEDFIISFTIAQLPYCLFVIGQYILK